MGVNSPLNTTIDLLRHGEVNGLACYRGITDDPLTERGWEQMQAAVNNNEWDLIVSSPLCRCLDFATQSSRQRKIPLNIEVGFQEINFGDWEGKTADEIEKNQPDALMAFYADPFKNSPPNGEMLTDFHQRIQNAWRQLLIQHQGKHILIITHAGVIRALFSLLLKIPIENNFSIQVNHACLSSFQCFHSEDGDFTQLNFHNRT